MLCKSSCPACLSSPIILQRPQSLTLVPTPLVALPWHHAWVRAAGSIKSIVDCLACPANCCRCFSMPQAGGASGTLHPRQDSKIFCGGLSWGTTAEKLEAYFSNFGQARLAVLTALCGSRSCMQSLTSSSSVQVLEAFVSYDRHTGRPRGFGKCLEHTVLLSKGAETARSSCWLWRACSIMQKLLYLRTFCGDSTSHHLMCGSC